MTRKKLNVVVWNEFRHEKTEEACREIYPDGIHGQIKKFLEANDTTLNVRLAALDDLDQGLPDEVLNDTDVLIWWGHMAHDEVSDALVEKISARVFRGKMGLIVLHSGHQSKVFTRIVGTNGNLSCGRDQQEILWNLLPSHPIAAGIPDHFDLFEELYCEPFYIPRPDALVFGAWFADGYLFRAGLCYHRGAGKVFYFQPGHEYCRSYYNPYVQKIICNAVKWAAPAEISYPIPEGCVWMSQNLTEEFSST